MDSCPFVSAMNTYRISHKEEITGDNIQGISKLRQHFTNKSNKCVYILKQCFIEVFTNLLLLAEISREVNTNLPENSRTLSP